MARASRKEYNKEWFAKLSPNRRMLYSAKRRAKMNGLECNIDETDIIIPEKCPILDIPLVVSKEKQTSSSPSLDRVNPKLGYVKGNVRVISYKANACKNNMTSQQIERLYRYVFGLGE